MGILIGVLALVFVAIYVVNKANKQQHEGKVEVMFHEKDDVSKIHVSSVLDANGNQAADIIGAINSGDWDWARAALQKIAYSMVGSGVTQAQKDEFKGLMIYFADRDPLYKALLKQLLPVIKREPGILQSKIYDFAPEYDQETIRYVLYFAHELGDINRVKKGRSYNLFPKDVA